MRLNDTILLKKRIGKNNVFRSTDDVTDKSCYKNNIYQERQWHTIQVLAQSFEWIEEVLFES